MPTLDFNGKPMQHGARVNLPAIVIEDDGEYVLLLSEKLQTKLRVRGKDVVIRDLSLEST